MRQLSTGTGGNPVSGVARCEARLPLAPVYKVAALGPPPHASLLMSSYSSHASLPLSGPSVKLTWA